MLHSCYKAISTVWAPSRETRKVSIGIENVDVIVHAVSIVHQRSQELEDKLDSHFLALESSQPLIRKSDVHY